MACISRTASSTSRRSSLAPCRTTGCGNCSLCESSQSAWGEDAEPGPTGHLALPDLLAAAAAAAATTAAAAAAAAAEAVGAVAAVAAAPPLHHPALGSSTPHRTTLCRSSKRKYRAPSRARPATAPRRATKGNRFVPPCSSSCPPRQAPNTHRSSPPQTKDRLQLEQKWLRREPLFGRRLHNFGEGVAQCKKIGGVDGAEEVSSVISFGLPREHYGVEGAGGGYPRDFQGHPDRQQSKPIHNNVHTEPQIQGASLPNCRTRGRRPEPGCRNGKTCFSLFVGQGRGWVVGGISDNLYTLNKQQAGRRAGLRAGRRVGGVASERAVRRGFQK